MNLPNIFAIITLLITSSRDVLCLEREMTVQVNAKERECFFERVGESLLNIMLNVVII